VCGSASKNQSISQLVAGNALARVGEDFGLACLLVGFQHDD
jgi:hypothetical protein